MTATIHKAPRGLRKQWNSSGYGNTAGLAPVRLANLVLSRFLLGPKRTIKLLMLVLQKWGGTECCHEGKLRKTRKCSVEQCYYKTRD